MTKCHRGKRQILLYITYKDCGIGGDYELHLKACSSQSAVYTEMLNIYESPQQIILRRETYGFLEMVDSIWFRSVLSISGNMLEKHSSPDKLCGNTCRNVCLQVRTLMCFGPFPKWCHGSPEDTWTADIYADCSQPLHSELLDCNGVFVTSVFQTAQSPSQPVLTPNVKSNCPPNPPQLWKVLELLFCPPFKPLSDYWVWGELHKQSATKRRGPGEKKI